MIKPIEWATIELGSTIQSEELEDSDQDVRSNIGESTTYPGSSTYNTGIDLNSTKNSSLAKQSLF